MMTSLMLVIGSMFFIILLMITYFSKQRFLSIRNKLYRYMLLNIIVLGTTEIIMVESVYLDAPDFIKYFCYRINWYSAIVLFSFTFYYYLCLFKDLQANSLFDLIKNNRTARIFNIFMIMSSITFFILPFSKLDKNNLTFTPGFASYYVLGYCISIVILIIIFDFKDILKKKNNRMLVNLLLFEILIVYMLQTFFPNISVYVLGMNVSMYVLYFLVENPDLKIISEVEALKKDVEKSSKAKSDFLSNMSHEIRTPMNAIVGYSQMLLNSSSNDSDVLKNDIKHIRSAGNSLLDIINNILDISKIESGNETLDMKIYSLSSIVMELTSIIEARLSNKPVKLIIDVDKNTPKELYGDSTKLFQILLNILTNSIKYTEVGKIKLSINTDIVGEMANLHFKISDTGYGIKKEDYDKLFEKFSRLDNAISNEIEGTGLGLVITKKYVDLMKGKIWFESEYEVGTTFYVDISQKIINKSKIEDIKEPIKVDKVTNFIDCSQYKVLVVDDNKLNIKVASKLLSAYKFQIDTSSSGKDCIYKVKNGNKYDMIFLDHMMPELDGIETLHILKKIDGYDIPPVVALTANAITGMKEMYLKEGFNEYLSKPINTMELDKLINKYFKDGGIKDEKNN